MNKNSPVLTDALTGLPLSESLLPRSSSESEKKEPISQKAVLENAVGNAFLHNPVESATDCTGYVTHGLVRPEEAESYSEILNVAVEPDNNPDPDVNLESDPR